MSEEKEIPQPLEVDPKVPPVEKAVPAADSTTLIDKANEAAERLEASNKEMARLISIQQQAQVEKTLGGETTAGVKALTKDEKDIQNAKEFLKGSGMDVEAFPEEKQN
jgi:hypothetical protein